MATLVPVFFRLHESDVDAALQSLDDQGLLPDRAFVVGTDAQRLATLNRQWQTELNLVIVKAPEPSTDIEDAVLLILEHEFTDLTRLIWVHGPDSWSHGLPTMRAVIRAHGFTAEALSRQIADIMLS